MKLDMSHAGLVRLAVKAIAIAMVLYHMGAIAFGTSEALILRATHSLLATLLVFLLYGPRRPREGAPPSLFDYGLLVLAAAPILYIFAFYDYIATRIYYIDDLTTADTIMAILAIVLVLEATRRLVDWSLPITS